MLAFYIQKTDSCAMEGDVERSKVVFITNFHLFRVGYYNLRTHRYMRMMKDPEPHQWSLPYQKHCLRTSRCSGKTIADSVESLTGAHFLSQDSLVKTLKWISKIKLVPLPQEIIGKFEHFEETSFCHLKQIDLVRDCGEFCIGDSLSQIFGKYFQLEVVKAMPEAELVRDRILPLLQSQESMFDFGSSIKAIAHLKGKMFTAQALKRLKSL